MNKTRARKEVMQQQAETIKVLRKELDYLLSEVKEKDEIIKELEREVRVSRDLLAIGGAILNEKQQATNK